jgi:hypothetical protein
MSAEIRKAVAYIRTKSATDKDSLRLQEAAIDAYAKAAGYEIIAIHYDVASGADPIDKRFGLIEMLRLVGNGVRTILIESPDRFAHDSLVQFAGHEVLKAKGVSLIAVSDPTFFIENTPTAVLVRQLLDAVAQFEEATRRVAPEHAPAVKSVVELLQGKGFQIRPRFRVRGPPQFYVWGGPVEAKQLHVKHELTAEELTKRYHLWLTRSPTLTTTSK